MMPRARPWLFGLTIGLMLGAVLGAATVSRGTASRADASLEARLAALEATIQGLQGFIDHVGFVEGTLNGLNGPHLLFEGVNVHIRSGSGSTTDGVDFSPLVPPSPGALFGLGNLIIGYNDTPDALADGDRGGSHTLIIGDRHRYWGAGGFVSGVENTVAGLGSGVLGGFANIASSNQSSVTGGQANHATGRSASVGGGQFNTASGGIATVSGGTERTAGGLHCWSAGTQAVQCP